MDRNEWSRSQLGSSNVGRPVFHGSRRSSVIRWESGGNVAPTFTSTPVVTATEDSVYSYTITTDDAESDSVTIAATTKPSWLTFTDNADGTATLTGTPLTGDVGDNSVALTVSDANGTRAQNFTIVVDSIEATVYLPSTLKPVQTALTFPITVGTQVREPSTGTVIECVHNDVGWRHGSYSVGSPENSDGTLVMLHNDADGTGSSYQDRIYYADSLTLYRDKLYNLGAYRLWSYTDPDDLFCIYNDGTGTTNQLHVYHPSTDTFELLFDFPNEGFSGYDISFGGGDGCQDWADTFMPILADNGTTKKLIVFNLKTKLIHSQIDFSTIGNRDGVNVPVGPAGMAIPTDPDDGSFTMSRDGAYCVLWRGGAGTNTYHSAYEIFNNDWTNRREVGALDANGTWVTMHVSHMVTGVDVDGNQVLCGEQQPNEHHYVRLDQGNTIEFVRYPAKAFGHQSTSKGLPGYVSSYGYSTAPDDPYFDGTIALLLSPLKKVGEAPVFSANDHGLPMWEGAALSEARQYGFHRSVGLAYTVQPQAALTTSGAKLYFVSNNSGTARGYRVYADDLSAT